MTNAVVITGGGSGIGRAIATRLAKRGWQVVVTDINPDAAKTTAASLPLVNAGPHEAAQLDVVSVEDATHVAEDVSERLGLGAWVNNAGISYMQAFVDVSEEHYDSTLNINLKGVFVCGQAAARAMVVAGNGGQIVNTASMAGKQGRVPFLTDYVASKFGVVGLTQAMAYELGPHDIRVNSVCPGFVMTPMQDRELEWEASLRQIRPEEVSQLMLNETPLGRLQTPDDIAKVVGFLLSDDAGAMTGEALAVNGGAYMD